MNYQRIIDLAEKRNLSIRKLCELAEITTAGFYKMIKQDSMTVKNLEKISLLLGVQANYFLDENVNFYNQQKDSVYATNLNESEINYQKNFFSPEEQKLREENSRLMVENTKLRQEVSTLKDKIIKLLESKV